MPPEPYIPQPSSYTGQPPPQQDIEAPWLDQFNYHMTLTVQAFQRLHSALDGKFTR